MKEVFIVDLKMLQNAAGSEPEQLLRRQRQLMVDLYRLVPRLSSLSFGEIHPTWIAASDAWWLRLQLAPRKQGLLFDPMARSRSRPGSLLEEAKQVWQDIAESPLRALRAVAGLRKWAAKDAPIPLDPHHEMAYRLSKKQWSMESEWGQLCLMFGEAPRYKVDPGLREVTGVVDVVLSRAIVLRHVWVGTADGSTGGMQLKESLRVVPYALAAAKPRSTPWELSQRVKPGEVLALNVTLHRCVMSKRVIGAVAEDV